MLVVFLERSAWEAIDGETQPDTLAAGLHRCVSLP